MECMLLKRSINLKQGPLHPFISTFLVEKDFSFPEWTIFTTNVKRIKHKFADKLNKAINFRTILFSFLVAESIHLQRCPC